MILSLGKPTITFGDANDTAQTSPIDTPKEDTTKLTTEAGEEVTATEEGGGVVDSYFKSGTATLEFTLFKKKGKALPFVDKDGRVAAEHSFKVVPEDPDAPKFVIPRASISVTKEYTAADGVLVTYACKALKPTSGDMVQFID